MFAQIAVGNKPPVSSGRTDDTANKIVELLVVWEVSMGPGL